MKKIFTHKRMRHFLRKHFISIFVIVFVLAAGMIIEDMLRVRIIKLTSLETASIYIRNMESFHALHTLKAVEQVQPHGHGVDTGHGFAGKVEEVLLPATPSMESSEEHSKSAITRLYSDFPFPWREEGGMKDQFERVALFKLRRNPEKPYYEFVNYKGVWSLRYAKADIMHGACVSCHNSHPQSPRRDWRTGDVRGVLEIVLPVKKINPGSIKAIQDRFPFLQNLLGS